MEAADELAGIMERVVAAVRAGEGSPDPRAKELAPAAHAAVEALGGLHRDLVAAEVLEEEAASAALEAVRERAQALQQAIP